MKLEIKKLNPEAKLPTRSYPTDAGLDLYSVEAAEINPGEGYCFSTGVAANIPENTYLHIHTRSSISKKGLIVVGGVCDSSYKGELSVMLRNISNTIIKVEKFDRIAQAVLYPIFLPEVIEVDDIGTSTRGTGGYGSTGR